MMLVHRIYMKSVPLLRSEYYFSFFIFIIPRKISVEQDKQ